MLWKLNLLEHCIPDSRRRSDVFYQMFFNNSYFSLNTLPFNSIIWMNSVLYCLMAGVVGNISINWEKWRIYRSISGIVRTTLGGQKLKETSKLNAFEKGISTSPEIVFADNGSRWPANAGGRQYLFFTPEWGDELPHSFIHSADFMKNTNIEAKKKRKFMKIH